MEFKGKVIMITGSGSGIGRAASVMFAKEGAIVAACDINEKNIYETEEIIRKQLNAEAVGIKLDVTNGLQVNAEIRKVIDRYEKIDVLVNSAGIVHLGKVENITEEEWDRVLDVNLKGTFLCCKAVIPIMKSRRSGCIINVTAAAAKTGGMNVGGNYVASKGGISSFTIHLAKQLAPFKIRVNAVSPGPIDTPMLSGDTGGGNYSEEMKKNIEKSTPLGLGFPEDIAHGILFLASDIRARYITGEILDIDGGLFMD